MELAQDITSICRVRVLLIPVSPIKKSVFYKYVQLVKTFHLVRLGDVTPDLKQGSSAMFSSQVFQEGQLHFQFQTHWTREHAELEDFQPHRRIFGVIGIMDCQEWKDKDLSDGYRQFAEGLDKYPTAVATRCFAFDPTETQADDTKGLIMIPNVGNMSFYMSTMICDFTSEILNQFALIAGRIEKLNILESPIPTTHVTSRSRPIPNRLSSPPSLASSSSVTNISISNNNNNNNNNNYKRSSLSLQTTNSSGPMPQPSISRNQSIAVGENMKSKKRTPGRIKKLLGDFYLLAGRLPDAVNHYDQAIEMAKLTSDFLWLASAMEGWICATLLLEYLQADVGHIVSRRPPPSPSSSSSSIKETEQTQTSPKSTLALVIQNYRSIITSYTKVVSTASFPAPDLVYAEACLKIARFLATAYITDQWSDTLPLLVQGTFPNQVESVNKRRKNGLARYDIAIWITKIWEIQISELSLLDQINLATNMSTVYSAIGYQRKGAWLLHESIGYMLPLIIQHRRTGLSKEGHNKSEHGIGVLELIKRICEVYGIGEQNVHDGGALEAMQDDNIMLAEPKVNGGVRGAASKETVRFGWPELQIDILKQCISVAEALIDNGARLYYTTVLLKNLYQYISKSEQIRLATTIQSLVSRPNQLESINYWGVNIVLKIEAKKPISRKAVYEHPIKSEIIKTEMPSDPFIYNPFAQKKKDTQYKVVLVKDETCEFKVTLVNPFGFDLDLQSITLSTLGIAFNAIPTAVTISANATIHVLLTGIPEETGELTIRGCLIRIVGFSEQEFLVDPEIKKNSDMSDGFVKIKKQGLKAIKTNRKRETSSEMRPIQYYQLSVIDNQPLLKIKKTSLLHGAVMLFEGEVTYITMELENIGSIAVDFITLSFTDSTAIQPINPELSEEEQYELELYTKGTRAFSWEGSSERKTSDFIGKKIWLPPGEAINIKVKVYGKRDCRGGTIQVDYGYLDRVVKDILGTEKPNMFYTRQLYLNVMITVYQNLDPFNWDIVNLRHSIPASKQALENAVENIKSHNKAYQPIEDILVITQNIDLENQELNEFCLVTLDVRNTWTAPFEVNFSIDNGNGDDEPGFTIKILPGSTTRVVLPLKRLFLSSEACNEPIPSFDPNKQFVVSQGPKMSEEQQLARLQMFWYREQLLGRIKAKWRCSATGRSGTLNLRPSSRLSASQLSILKKEDIEFFIDVKNALKISRRRFSCGCGTRVALNITIRNRFSHPVKLILRMQPVQSYSDGLKEYDLSNKMLLEGTEQLVLPEIPANATSNVLEFPIFFLSRGQFEILYHVEDVHTRKVYYDHEWTIVDVLEQAI